MEKDISWCTSENTIYTVKTEIEFSDHEFKQLDKERFQNMEFVSVSEENGCTDRDFKVERQDEDNERHEVESANFEETGKVFVQNQHAEPVHIENIICEPEHITKKKNEEEKSKCNSLDGGNGPLTGCESGMCKKQNKNSSLSDQYLCHICNKSFSFKNSLQRHYSVHSNTKSYACVVCNKLFSRRGDMIIHCKRHKNKESKLFIQDTEKSNSLLEFKKEDSETSVQNFDHVGIQSTCDICNNSFANKSSLKRHMLIHAGERNHLCLLCNKSFIRKSDLNIHYERHKNRINGNKSYACDLCEKTFSSKVYIYQHMQIHTPVRSYKCHLCTKVYKWQATLQEHLKNHNGANDVEKNHVCEICAKPFRRFKELKEHVVVHTGEKPHVCVLCGKAYRWKSDLRKHVKTHTGEIHVCHICGKSFSVKQNLTRHMAVHSDIRPYKCLMCDKSYRDNRLLKNHFKIHINPVAKNEDYNHITLSNLLDFFNV